MTDVRGFERIVELLRRELGAENVFVLPEAVTPALAHTWIDHPLPNGRKVYVTFGTDIEDRDARVRRLEMLVDSFREVLGAVDGGLVEPPGRSLHAALSWLAERATASDVLVIDAQSPVLWGAAAGGTVPSLGPPPKNVVPLDPTERSRASQAPPPAPSLADRAIEAVRAMPTVARLHKGGHLHATVREEDFGFIARSFATIYVLVLVFEGRFDELRAERGATQALPVIERLVLALPPIEPDPPVGTAAAVRRRR